MEQYFPDWLMVLWNYEIADHSLGQIAIALLVFFVILLGIRIVRGVFLRKFSVIAERTVSTWDDAVIAVVKGVSNIFFLLVALFVTVEFFLVLQPALENFIRGVFIVSFAYEILKVAQEIVSFGLAKSAIGKNKTSLQGVKLVANIALWAIGALMVLDNLGFDITTLAASLGIGGIAIALAAQNILGDLFSSFTIYFDKPFQVGDYIVVGAHEGIVKKIGLKTTRIEALRGEELVISNKELTESRVQNFKKLKTRRVQFEFGVTYDTSAAKLRMIPEIVKEVVKKVEMAEFNRTHFHTFDDSSLGFITVYHVSTGKKSDHMTTQQEINLGILERFTKEKIEMAFPTQTVYLKKN